jgi:hypothetical protein
MDGHRDDEFNFFDGLFGELDIDRIDRRDNDTGSELSTVATRFRGPDPRVSQGGSEGRSSPSAASSQGGEVNTRPIERDAE